MLFSIKGQKWAGMGTWLYFSCNKTAIKNELQYQIAIDKNWFELLRFTTEIENFWANFAQYKIIISRIIMYFDHSFQIEVFYISVLC